MSPRAKLFMFTVLITVLLLSISIFLSYQLQISYFIRGLGMLALLLTIAIWSLATRIRKK
ncbi:hypothetical protein KAU25_03945 [Candidatus Bathyarchaeota archaeon]|nr:hypothetical protein [Candidatus Bathyarchaeota archaeon]